MANNLFDEEEEEEDLLPAPKWEDFECQKQSFNVGHREIYHMDVFCKPCGRCHLWLHCPKPRLH